MATTDVGSLFDLFSTLDELAIKTEDLKSGGIAVGPQPTIDARAADRAPMLITVSFDVIDRESPDVGESTPLTSRLLSVTIMRQHAAFEKQIAVTGIGVCMFAVFCSVFSCSLCVTPFADGVQTSKAALFVGIEFRPRQVLSTTGAVFNVHNLVLPKTLVSTCFRQN